MKIYCPKCESVTKNKNAWSENEKDFFDHKSNGNTYMPVKDFPFCPDCKSSLEKSKIKATHIVLKNEFGGYVDIPIAKLPVQMQTILLNLDAYGDSALGNGQEQDDGSFDDFNSVWGGAGPDCIFVQGEPA